MNPTASWHKPLPFQPEATGNVNRIFYTIQLLGTPMTQTWPVTHRAAYEAPWENNGWVLLLGREGGLETRRVQTGRAALQAVTRHSSGEVVQLNETVLSLPYHQQESYFSLCHLTHFYVNLSQKLIWYQAASCCCCGCTLRVEDQPMD